MSLAKSDPYLRRYSLGERLNHWLVAISFVLLVLSGLPFFHPFFWSLTGLFGGPTMTRILHPWIGLFMVLMFAIMAVRFFKESLLRRHDIQWLKQIDDVLANRDEKLGRRWARTTPARNWCTGSCWAASFCCWRPAC
jgi:formate dehydrogenase subunit gamma